MNRMKNILTDKFDVIRRQNPNATVGNLVVGTLILVLLAVLSVWYFGKSGNETLQNLLTCEPTEELSEVQGNMVVVQEGEGLWQVAERVCGDGELYNKVAEENGFSVWSELNAGQELKVTC